MKHGLILLQFSWNLHTLWTLNHFAMTHNSWHQEYMIEERESILLHDVIKPRDRPQPHFEVQVQYSTAALCIVLQHERSSKVFEMAICVTIGCSKRTGSDKDVKFFRIPMVRFIAECQTHTRLLSST